MKKIILLAALLFPNIAHAQVIINEIAWMGTENSSNDEWIELWNYDENDIDLTGWKIEAADGSPTIELEGTIGIGEYFLLERTDDESVPNITADQIYSGALGNAGELLKLINAGGEAVDEIDATEGWPAGDNTSKYPMELVSENWQTGLNSTGTPGAENSTTEIPPEETPEESPEETLVQPGVPQTSASTKGDVVITEIFPNPKGIDTQKEFIEIQNVSKGNIDLTNWKIKNLAKQEYTISSLILAPNTIIALSRTKTKLALGNDKDKITLYNEKGRIINRVEYKNSIEDYSYQIDSEKKWRWYLPSAGVKNKLEIVVEPVPKIDGPKEGNVGEIITFDGSDSFDPKNRDFILVWNFGERIAEGLLARNIFFTPGTFEISLKAVVGEQASSTDVFKIKIIGEKLPVTSTPASTSASLGGPTSTKEIMTYNEIPYLFISEFLPNPEGSDAEGEFIEIFNNNQATINLKGWKLTDGNKTFIFGDTLIRPNQYLAVYRPQTKIAINNSNEEIQLLTPNDEIADLVNFEKSSEGLSFVLDENFIWQQTSTPTPGEINVLDETNLESMVPITPKVLGAQIEEISINEPQNKNKYLAMGITGIFALGLGVILKKRSDAILKSWKRKIK